MCLCVCVCVLGIYKTPSIYEYKYKIVLSVCLFQRVPRPLGSEAELSH